MRELTDKELRELLTVSVKVDFHAKCDLCGSRFIPILKTGEDTNKADCTNCGNKVYFER